MHRKLAALLPAAFWSFLIFAQQAFYFRDAVRFSFPLRWQVAEIVRQGTIPFWNSRLFAGSAFVAGLQSSVFYPPQALLYLLPFRLGYPLQTLLHFVLASVGMFVLLRQLKASPAAALLGSIVFSFASPLLAAAEYVQFFSALAWWPLAVLATVDLWEKSTPRHAAIFALVWSCIVLAGSPDAVVLAALLTLFFLPSCRPNVRAPRALLMAAGLLAGIVALQIVPFLNEWRHSDRAAGMSTRQVLQWTLQPLEWLSLIVPALYGGHKFKWFGQPYVSGLYIGTVSLALLFFAPWKTRRAQWLVGGAWLFAILAMADFMPGIGWVLTHTPVLSSMRYPSRYAYGVLFFLTILSALGFDAWLQSSEARKRHLLNALVVLSVIGFFVAFLQAPILQFYRRYFAKFLFEEVQTAWLAQRLFMMKIQFGWCAACLAAWLLYRLLPRSKAAGLLLVLAVVELLFLVPVFAEFRGLSAFIKPTAAAEILRRNPEHRLYFADPDPESFAELFHDHADPDVGRFSRETLAPMTGLVEGVSYANGYQGLLDHAMMQANLRLIDDINKTGTSPLLQEWGITHLMSRLPLNSPTFELLATTPYHLYVVTPHPERCEVTNSDNTVASCSITRPTPNDMTIHLPVIANAAHLLIRERYHHGWQALVNGQPRNLKSKSAYGLTMTLPLLPGDHDVQLHYREIGWPYLGWLSIFCAAIAMWLVSPWRPAPASGRRP